MTTERVRQLDQRFCAALENSGKRPFDFQRETWRAVMNGESGLLHAPTGMGKTLAVWLGAVGRRLLFERQDKSKSKLRVLWLTPLRALAGDTTAALASALSELGLEHVVESRTGDTAQSVKARQEKKPPFALVTTPESLCLLLSRSFGSSYFSGLETIVVDEWHELLGSKRGALTEPALARLRAVRPGVCTWGLSATLGNLDEALDHLIGRTAAGEKRSGRLIRAELKKDIVIDCLLPDPDKRIPWAGHLGLAMLPKVLAELDKVSTALVFTNTRAQTELWHQAILEARPQWAGRIALHHGSIAQEERAEAEQGLKEGRLRCVVCTSSLDLGVDFSPVERVLQVGSPKGVARLLQRAGRSGHGPGRVSRVTCVPAYALETVEAAAAREASAKGRIESRRVPGPALDVLAQHMVTVALGQGFRSDELLAEVRTTAAFADISQAEWDWTLEFVTKGGKSLSAYPHYHRVVEEDGVFRVQDKGIAQRHRLMIGTIMSDASMTVRYLKGGRLGTVEESFINKLKPGDGFLFAGKRLKLVRVDQLTAYVRNAPGVKGATPVWYGGRMPLSTELGLSVREMLDQAARGRFDGPEMRWAKAILRLQAEWSRIPRLNESLIEIAHSREGLHLYVFPFEGRLAHEGLAALTAYRLSRLKRATFSWSVNDYGFELLTEKNGIDEARFSDMRGLFDPADLAEDILMSLNHSEMARHQFREIARVAGLLFTGYPGKGKTARQLQTSGGLLFDVFAKYDPDNLLYRQAHREALQTRLDESRLKQALKRMYDSDIVVERPGRFTPLSFPLMTDRLRHSLTSETFADRLERLVKRQESLVEATGKKP